MRPCDLSLTVSQRRLACVLDPALALGHALGPTLALRLTQVLEPWLTRSFWQVIDSSELLQRRLERVAALVPANQDPRPRPDVHALRTWISLRERTDAGSWPLRWVGDNLPQSQLKDAADADIVERFEQLTAALVERAQVSDREVLVWSQGLDPVLGALDTLALSACLGGAMVLSLQPCGEHGDPWPVQALARVGLPAVRLDPMPPETLFATERMYVRDALVSAGLATLSERLPPLVVVHVALQEPALCEGDPWSGACAWWYPV